MNAFHAWVANTIAELGGNPSEYLCGIEREHALTYDRNRMVACQWDFDSFFTDKFLDSTRVSAVADTNLMLLH